MPKRPAKDYSLCQENEIAHLLNGKVQPNSGGTKFGGGDVHTRTFLIEAKTPTKCQTSFSIKQDWIDKMQEQAFEQGKQHSALAFRFEPDGEDFFVIDSRTMRSLIDMYEYEMED